MEFTYSREQQMVKKMLREFAEKEIAPIASEIDEKAIYPYETIGKLAKLGLMGMAVSCGIRRSGNRLHDIHHGHRRNLQDRRLPRSNNPDPQRPVLLAHIYIRHRRTEEKIPA